MIILNNKSEKVWK